MLKDDYVLQQIKKDIKKMKEDAESSNFFNGGNHCDSKQCGGCGGIINSSFAKCPYCGKTQKIEQDDM